MSLTTNNVLAASMNIQGEFSEKAWLPFLLDLEKGERREEEKGERRKREGEKERKRKEEERGERK